MRPLTPLLLAAAGLLAASAGTARADFLPLGPAGPDGLNLGVFVTGPTVMSASNGQTTFDGNLGLAAGASTNFSGGGTLTGNLYLDPGASLQPNFNSQFNVLGTVEPLSLAAAVAGVQSAATNYAGLTPNQTYGAVGGSPLTLTATGDLNSLGGRDTVVQVGSINITNPANNLTVTGGANDYFVINVLGGVTVSNGMIVVDGAIAPSHVVFNVEGTGDSVRLTNGTSVLSGTYLAPFAGQKITLAPGTVDGAIIGYQVQTSSGPTVNGWPFSPPPDGPPTSQVPAPASALLAGLALVPALLGRGRWGVRTAV